MSQWIATDDKIRRLAERPSVNPFGHRWNPPTWDYIEPLKDASADLMIISSGLDDFGHVQRKRGRDPDVVLDNSIKWNRLRIEKAIQAADEINTANPGASITWRDIAQMPLPQGVQMSIDAAGNTGGSTTAPDDADQPEGADDASE